MSVLMLDEQLNSTRAQTLLNRKQKACMYIPNTPLHIDAMKWMEQYFAISGDYQPNSNEEIHLDPIKKIFAGQKITKHSMKFGTFAFRT